MPLKISLACERYDRAQPILDGRVAIDVCEAKTGIKVVHVPYKGGSPAAANAVIAGEVQFGVVALNSVVQFVKNGRLKAFAVSTGKRSPLVPDLPTLAELGAAGIDAAVRVGMYSPAGTPRAVTGRVTGRVDCAWKLDYRIQFVVLTELYER